MPLPVLAPLNSLFNPFSPLLYKNEKNHLFLPTSGTAIPIDPKRVMCYIIQHNVVVMQFFYTYFILYTSVCISCSTYINAGITVHTKQHLFINPSFLFHNCDCKFNITATQPLCAIPENACMRCCKYI